MTLAQAKKKLRAMQPDQVVEMQLGLDENNEGAVQVCLPDQKLLLWLQEPAQRTVFSYDMVSIEAKGIKQHPFPQESLLFTVQYFYTRGQIQKIKSFENYGEALDFYNTTYKSIYCCNVVADFETEFNDSLPF